MTNYDCPRYAFFSGTATGITAMLLYYRYFHPVGPINPCLEYAESSEKNNVLFTGGETQGDSASFHDRSRGPDFEIQSEDVFNSPGSGHELETPPRPPPRRSRVQHSRSFKDSCPPAKRSQTPKKPKKSNHKRRMAEAAAAATRESSCSPVGVKSPAVLEEPVESAYGTDSNRTVSRSTVSPPLHSPSSHTDDPNDSGTSSADANKSSGSGKSAAFNNDTYMSVENAERQSNDPAKKSTNNTYMSVKSPSTGPQANQSNELELSRSLSQCSQPSIDSRITVIERADLVMKTPEKKSTDDQPEKLLKRSPIVKDVTSGFAQVMSTASLKSQGSCNQPGPIPPRKRDGLTAPLTIIIPNISHQAITRSKSGDLPGHQQQQTPGAASEEITTERLDPNREGNIDSLSAHDYENLALININRTALGVTHWRTYSDMANSKHDESTAYERQKLSKTSNSDYSNYNSLQYYDIYPLSKEIKQQLYRSLTPVSSTAATMATSDTATNVTDSDTYEPIESFAPGAWINQFPDGANASGNLSSLSSNSSSGIPVTLIHHDGEKLTTKQIISLDNLKDVLKKHETVPMDDPQDRGDLYLLAPMRLLTPILEESESDSTRTTDPSYNNVAYGNQLNKSIMTVISEMLGSVSGTRPPLQPFPKSTAGAMANESFGQMSADGRFPESIESTSSLVHTIDEIRNNSLCNLFFSSVADLGSPAPKNNSQSAAPQVPPRNSPPVKPTPLLISPSANNTSTSVQPSTSKSISETPVTTNRPSFENDDEKENVVNSVPPEARNKKISPLVFGIGSRQNILEMTAGKTTNHILNTPSKKSNPNKLSLPVAVASAQVTVPLPLPSLETNDINTQGVLRESTSSGIVSQNSSLHSIRQQNMTLSPSRKYDETPTPPLRDRQFIRNSQLNRPRRKFSIIRDKFESDNEDSPNPVRRFGTNSNADLYENVSDDLLNNDLSHISKMSSSTPSFIDSKDFELKPDDKYENLHRGWATSSMQKPGVRGWNPQQPGAPKQQQQQQRTQSNNNPNRRSMSGIDNYYAASTARFVDNKTDRKSVVGIEHVRSLGKENRQVEENPPELKPKPSQPITRTSRMPLLSPGSKLRSRILTGSPQRTYRVSSLSPQSKIFTKK